MKTIEDYKVISGCTEKQLAYRVNECIKEGYDLVGGVSVCAKKTNNVNIPYTYAQSLIKSCDT